MSKNSSLYRSMRLVCALSLVLLGDSTPAKEPATFADPEATKTDPDFLVQGEYAGVRRGAVGEEKLGVQVVARGEGAFDVVLFVGGLPGDGWEAGERKTAKAKTVVEKSTGGAARFESSLGAGEIGDGKIILVPSGGAPVELRRVERKSPTLGEKPPEGALVLFDGRPAEHFDGKGPTTDGLLPAGQTSKRLFGDARYHVEFRTPYKPAARGQDRGNSGCYLQGRYEVQVLDSFGEAGRMDDCGGIYSIAAPRLNMCFPPLSWQTFDIGFTAARFDAAGKKSADARMTVRHNGVLVHRDVALPKWTTAAPVTDNGPAPGPLYLQDHGNPVVFRNLWVVETK